MTTFYLKTLGCKVNQYDSQFIREQFLSTGFREAGPEDRPDICIVNTCSVTGRAQAKGRNYINHLRREYPKAIIIVTGCTVDYQPETIEADFLVPNQEKSSLINIVMSEGKANGSEGITSFTGRTRAFVKVQDGCNEFCSYCILPYVRGRSKSRDFNNVINEVKRLVNNGYREVVLTGIHLGDYGKDKGKSDALVELLGELEKIPQLLRIRLSSLEPQDITEQLIDKVTGSEKICRHLHIPLQSGDSAVLRHMNRRYVYEEYRSLLNTIAGRIPEISFTTDIMAGFPGETEEQFLGSCKAVEEIGFAKVHIFPYSVRAGTAAAKFPDRVPSKDIKRRVGILQKIAQKSALKVKEKLIGSIQEVLMEKSGINPIGYTSGYIPTIVRDDGAPNTLVRVRITGIDGQYLTGRPLTLALSRKGPMGRGLGEGKKFSFSP